MVDIFASIALVLCLVLIVYQDYLIKRKDRIIQQQGMLLVRVEPILAAMVAAQEEFRLKELENKPEQPKVH